MRADAHYVEQLDTASDGAMIQLLSAATIAPRSQPTGDPSQPLVDSIRRHGVLQPLLVHRSNGEVRLIDGERRLHAAIAAGLREVPCLVRHVEDGELVALAEAANVTRREHAVARPAADAQSRPLDIQDDLMRAIAAIDSSTHLLSNAGAGLPHAVGTDLIRAEAWRASCLLQASRILQEGVPPAHAGSSARRLVTYVAERAEPDRRLRGYVLHVDSDIPEHTLIGGDQRILATALSGLLLAIGAAAGGVAGARMTLTASIDTTRQVELAVAEVGAPVPASWESRIFDHTWSERPGGTPAAVCMLAAQKVAVSYGGRISLSTNARGVTARLIMPVAAA